MAANTDVETSLTTADLYAHLRACGSEWYVAAVVVGVSKCAVRCALPACIARGVGGGTLAFRSFRDAFSRLRWRVLACLGGRFCRKRDRTVLPRLLDARTDLHIC